VTESNRRRSDRIFSRLPVRITGIDAGGATFVEETHTLSLGEHGACISLRHNLRPDDGVLVTNLRNGMEASFRVVGEVHHRHGNRGEWGLESDDPSIPIWGIDFNPPPVEVQPKVMLYCSACKQTRLSLLNSIEYDVLLNTGTITEHCVHCAEITRWHAADSMAEAEASDHVPQTRAERRRQRRRSLTMLVRIRNGNGHHEIVQTVDASSSGICFLSRHQYRVGEEVYLVLPSPRGEMPTETKGRVVRLHETPEGQRYGVNYI